MAHPQHEQVRQRYEGRCGYCRVSEIDAGGELTVDHHQPVAAGGEDSADNLVYACYRCNQYKTDCYPDEEEREQGHRILHPLLDDLTLHYYENEYGRLIPLTETGRYHITILRLNRPQLVEHRLRKHIAALERESNQHLWAVVEQLRRSIAELESRYPHWLSTEDTDSEDKNL